jgi:hypothetical protein
LPSKRQPTPYFPFLRMTLLIGSANWRWDLARPGEHQIQLSLVHYGSDPALSRFAAASVISDATVIQFGKDGVLMVLDNVWRTSVGNARMVRASKEECTNETVPKTYRRDRVYFRSGSLRC